MRIARLARAGGLPDWIKLEVIPDQRYLLPDRVETLRAAATLVEDGFTVLPYVIPDPVLAKKLEEVGCATVMPLAAPIGSGRGLKLRDAIRIIIEQAEVPVVVDAGLGSPSHAAEAMELGADAVLVNTAIAHAADPVAMARAFALGVEAGRAAFLAGCHGGARDGAAVEPGRRGSSPRRERLHRQRHEPRARAGRDRRAAARAPRARRAVRARRAKRRAGRARRVRARRSSRKATSSWSRARWPVADLFADSARLYLVTGVRPDLADFLEAAVRGGVDAVQIRERGLLDGELLAALHEAREVTHRLAVPLVVNDRPDLAAARRRRRRPRRPGRPPGHGKPAASASARGLSTHAPGEIDAAEADYIGVGPVLRHADEGGPRGGRPRPRPLRRRERDRSRGSRSAESTARTSSRSWRRARPESPSCGRSAMPRRPRSGGRESSEARSRARVRAGGPWWRPASSAERAAWRESA